MTRAPLNPQMLILLLGGQSIWNLAAAILLLRRSLAHKENGTSEARGYP